MDYKKKLIEVALPLEEINKESAREKSIRHGHPSTLHLWWARRPLAASRAVIFSSLVDDPSSHPEEFPSEEAQVKERQRLFAILRNLVKWENLNNQEVLNEAIKEIKKSTNGKPPALLDPFAGGGAIPLEAQRLGLETHASDLNPVAVMINKAIIEIPARLAGKAPVNPESLRKMDRKWTGSSGLAEDILYYGKWIRERASARIGHLYPKIKDKQGHEHIVIAWIWTRTIKCPNPMCGCEMPLASSFILSKKKGREAYIQPIIKDNKVVYDVRYGKKIPEAPKISRDKFKCVVCRGIADSEYIREEFKSKRAKVQLMAIVAKGNKGRVFISPDIYQSKAADCPMPEWKPEASMNTNCPDLISGRGYGFKYWYELFTKRQLTALTTYSDLVAEAQTQVEKDGGSCEYAKAVGVYLAFAIDRMTNINNCFVRWQANREQSLTMFSRQAIPMVWDYAENNIFNNAAGDLNTTINSMVKAILNLPAKCEGKATQFDAQSDNGLRDIMISTDPPYYDNISYADLSDFFYVWLRKMLKPTYPELFHTLLVPKIEELTAMSYRFNNGKTEARKFFEDGMLDAFKQIYIYACNDVPVTVYYAYKQSENENNKTSSTGWETMLSAIIKSGLIITGTWPIRTELANRMISKDTNALASSIVLVCRKRSANATICTRRDFINALKRELKLALTKLQESNIAPVDLAQSAIGPGMGVFSRFSKVMEADGSQMSIRSALQSINQELDLYFTEKEGELDRDSRFCVNLYTQYAFNDIKFGDADVLARAKNTSVEKLVNNGILYAQKGVVRLLTREEIPIKFDVKNRVIWLLTQQLTRALDKEGVAGAAKIVAEIYTSEPEHAKALGYRLFTIAESKGWAAEAYAYNNLVIAWPDIQAKAAELQAQRDSGKQMTLFSDN